METGYAEYAKPSERANFSISITSCGADPAALSPGHIYGPKLEEDWLLQYCVTGCGIFHVDGQDYPINAGDCIVTFPGQERIEQADSVTPWAFMWIRLGGNTAERFFSKAQWDSDDPVLPGCGETGIPTFLRQILDAAGSIDGKYDYLLASKLFLLLDECLRHRAALHSGSSVSCAFGGYVSQATAYIRAHYTNQDLTVQKIADMLGLNRSYFYEIFKKETGMSPQEYITQMRIQEGRRLLQDPHVTVAQVAAAIGYEPSVFSRAFRRVVGMPPSCYSQNYK